MTRFLKIDTPPRQYLFHWIYAAIFLKIFERPRARIHKTDFEELTITNASNIIKLINT